jgi:hypothetical protein
MITETGDAFNVETDELRVLSWMPGESSLLKLTGADVTWMVTIEGTYSLRVGHSFAGPATADNIIGRRVRSIRALKDGGELILIMDGGIELTVFGDQQFESWELLSSAGDRLVAVPGNGVALWRRPS